MHTIYLTTDSTLDIYNVEKKESKLCLGNCDDEWQKLWVSSVTIIYAVGCLELCCFGDNRISPGMVRSSLGLVVCYLTKHAIID